MKVYYDKDADLSLVNGKKVAIDVHYGQIVPRADLDVWMVAPKAPGHTVRSSYVQTGEFRIWLPSTRTRTELQATWR